MFETVFNRLISKLIEKQNNLAVVKDDYENAVIVNQSESIPGINLAQNGVDNFDKVVISDASYQNHIGTKLVANCINIINKQDPQPTDIKGSFTDNLKQKHSKFTMIVGILLVLLYTMIIIRIIIYAPSTVDYSVTPPHVTPTHTPTDWMVNSTEWGKINPNCHHYSYSTVAIDNYPGRHCTSKEACIEILRNDSIDFNFLIGDDGRVYEVNGWFCLSDLKYDMIYAGRTIKIGFIGSYDDQSLTTLQTNAFHKLTKYGVDHKYIKSYYALIPQCCRGFTVPKGPDLEILEFMKMSDKFQVAHCINEHKCKH